MQSALTDFTHTYYLNWLLKRLRVHELCLSNLYCSIAGMPCLDLFDGLWLSFPSL